MDKNVSFKDLRQAYLHTVCLWNGVPVYVVGIATNRAFQIKDLKTNKTTIEEFDHTKLKSPLGRLGMVNRNGAAYYLVRSTARVYQMGINSNNVVVEHIPNTPYDRFGLNRQTMTETCLSEVADTLMGIYPSFNNALEAVKTFGGIVAFDRQFAIDENRALWYKNHRVGSIPRGAASSDDVVFSNRYKHLSCVIGEISNEKIVRSIRS